MMPAVKPLSTSDDRRLHPRQHIHESAMLVYGRAETTVAAVIVDRSFRGMRLDLSAETVLPDAVTLLAPRLMHAFEARVVWNKRGQVGLAITRDVDMRQAMDPDTASLRLLWRFATSR